MSGALIRSCQKTSQNCSVIYLYGSDYYDRYNSFSSTVAAFVMEIIGIGLQAVPQAGRFRQFGFYPSDAAYNDASSRMSGALIRSCYKCS